MKDAPPTRTPTRINGTPFALLFMLLTIGYLVSQVGMPDFSTHPGSSIHTPTGEKVLGHACYLPDSIDTGGTWDYLSGPRECRAEGGIMKVDPQYRSDVRMGRWIDSLP